MGPQNLLRDTQDSRVQLEDMLRRAEEQQQQLDAQLADMESHRAKALAATAKGNSVLQDAESTLNTLRGNIIVSNNQPS